MQNKVEGHSKFAQMEQDCDVAALLEVLKESAFDSHDKQYLARQAANAWKQLAYCHQQEYETIVQFYRQWFCFCTKGCCTTELVHGKETFNILIRTYGKTLCKLTLLR
jgi:hypothetical protein